MRSARKKELWPSPYLEVEVVSVFYLRFFFRGGGGRMSRGHCGSVSLLSILYTTKRLT